MTLTDNGGASSTQDFTITVDDATVTPDAPTNAAASPGHATVHVTWARAPHATGYTILRSITGLAGVYDTLATVEGSNTTSYDDDTAPTNATSYYQIVAINDAGSAASSGSGDASAGSDSPDNAGASPAAPPSPTLDGNSSVDQGSVYTLVLEAGADPSDTIASWTVDWGDSTGSETFAGDSYVVTHTYANDGSKTITASATDDLGSYNAPSRNVTVNEVPPLVVAGRTAGLTVNPNTDYTLDLSAVYPFGDRQISHFTINWGDGHTDSNLDPATSSFTHQYTANGVHSYTIHASATDANGTYNANPVVVETNYINNFSNGAGSEWSNTSTLLSPTPIFQPLLGTLHGESETLTLSGLPEHQMFHVSFDLYGFGDWSQIGIVNGSIPFPSSFFSMKVDGETVTPDSTPNGTSAGLGYTTDNYDGGHAQDPNDNDCAVNISDAKWSVSFDCDSTESTLALEFLAAGLNTGYKNHDETWALANVMVAPEYINTLDATAQQAPGQSVSAADATPVDLYVAAPTAGNPAVLLNAKFAGDAQNVQLAVDGVTPMNNTADLAVTSTKRDFTLTATMSKAGGGAIVRTINAHVVTAEVSQLSFGAVTPGLFHPVLRDSGTPYPSVEWTEADAPFGAPIAYTISGGKAKRNFMNIDAQINVTGFQPEGQYVIRGTATGAAFGPSTAVLDGSATLSGNVLSATVASDIPVTNRVAEGNTNIAWDISPDNGTTWFPAGTTITKTYMIRGTPSTPQFETVLDIGCRNTLGARAMTDPSLVVAAIWSDFSPASGVGDGIGVKNVDRKVMTYWGERASAPPALGTDPFTQLPALMGYADGKCGAWAELFQYVLFDQGIQAWKVSIKPNEALKTQPTGPGDAVLVVNQTLRGQGKTAPQYYFNDHAVIQLTGRDLATGKEYRSLRTSAIYDPSYGVINTGKTLELNEESWRTKAESQVGWGTMSRIGSGVLISLLNGGGTHAVNSAYLSATVRPGDTEDTIFTEEPLPTI